MAIGSLNIDAEQPCKMELSILHRLKSNHDAPVKQLTETMARWKRMVSMLGFENVHGAQVDTTDYDVSYRECPGRVRKMEEV